MTNSFAMFAPPQRERQRTIAVVPSRRKPSPTQLPSDFEKKIISLEFKAEKGQISQEQVHELMELYNKASTHYDKIKERDHAEIYRQKIQMLFIKPAIMMILTGAPPQAQPPTKSKAEAKVDLKIKTDDDSIEESKEKPSNE